jgi:hypothetical protein
MAKKVKSKAVSQNGPQFGEIQPTGDPTQFKIPHPSDIPFYNLVNKKLLQKVPAPKNPNNMMMSLAQVLGTNGAARISQIQRAKKIVFHSGGDTGSVRGPQTECLVADKMVNDFTDQPTDIPSFFFHLGDIVYSFGEGEYYYDQFYEPYRDYNAPIFAIPGNHDGVVYKGDTLTTLEAFLRNFVSDTPVHTPEAGGLIRTAMTQPGVYFSLDAPFIRIIGLYSNVLEDPGVISTPGDKQQIKFLVNELKNAKQSGKAVLVAVHHPPFTMGTIHGGSPNLLSDLDNACKQAAFWPHAFLAGHSHNYQRFTRTVKNFNTKDSFDIPYIVCGNSGHNVVGLIGKGGKPLRTPVTVAAGLTFENYDDKNYGYLRIICDQSNLRIEYHDAQIQQKSESDVVTIDLATHTITTN